MTSPTEQTPPSPDDSDESIDCGQNAEGQPPQVDSEFEQALLEVERAIAALKDRYAQVQRSRHQQAQLQRASERVKQQLRQTPRTPRSPRSHLQQELRQIQQQLETIELNLESQLFTWGSLKEPFWQAVRFGGLGIIVGWLLKSCSG